MCPDGIVLSLKVKGAYPDSRHEAGMFRESELYAELDNFTVFDNANDVIYGDQ